MKDENEARARLREQSRRVLEFDTTKLGREDLGEFSFTELTEYANQIKLLLTQIKICSLDDTPYTMMWNIGSILQSLSAQYKIVESYDPTKAESDEHRRRINTEYCTSVRDYYQQLYTVTTPILFAHFMLQGDNGKQPLAKLTAEAMTILESTKATSENTLAECQTALDKVREMYQKAGVEARAANFKALADSHSNQAWWWLGCGIACGIALAAYLCFHFEPELNKMATQSMQHLIALSLSKLVAVSLLTYLLVACFRNYSAHKHNEVVNRGKQVALATFEQFVKATADEPTKNAILTHACQAIFSAQTSGYLRNEPEPAHSNQIIEIVRSITGKPGA